MAIAPSCAQTLPYAAESIFDWHGYMTGTVGPQHRTETIRDPAEALRRGRVLDAMLVSARVPTERGVWRLTHHAMNRMDEARQLKAARRLNTTSG